MSEKTGLTKEQIEKIAGGECTAEEWGRLSGELKASYDNLIDLASYMIERVANGTN